MTGAPLYLLHLCKYLKSKTEWEFYFLLKRDGPLKEEFSKLGTTFIYQERPLHTASTPVYTKIINRFKKLSFIQTLDRGYLKHKLKKIGFDIIYSNTVANGEILNFLSELKIKTITHVHELDTVIQSFGIKNLELVKQNTIHYITSSSSVTKNLFINLGIEADKVTETKYFPIHVKPVATDIKAVKASLGIPAESFIVGSAGTVEWRKGWDLFIKLAADYKKISTDEEIYFVWIGGFDENTKREIDQQIELSNLKDKVLFIGHRTNPMQIFSVFEVFCLMSREEAFGIVALEAALYSTPVMCFAGAEGLSCFVKDDAGYVIPGLDTTAMAKAIAMLRNDRGDRERRGRAACKRASEEYTLATQAEKIKDLLKSLENFAI